MQSHEEKSKGQQNHDGLLTLFNVQAVFKSFSHVRLSPNMNVRCCLFFVPESEFIPRKR